MTRYRGILRTGLRAWARFGLPAMAMLVLTGCGAQELYEPPESPYQERGRLALPSQVEDVAVLGDYAFIAGGQSGLLIVDISNPDAPVLVKMLDTQKFAEAVKVASTPTPEGVVDIAYVVEGTEGITTYNVTNPDSAYSFEQGTTAVDGNGLFVEMTDDPAKPYIVYLAENWKGLRIFESDPSTPGILLYHGVFSSTRGYAKSVAVKNGFAYIADDELGIAVLDCRSRVLGSVRVVSSCDTEGWSHGVWVDDDYVYVADGPNGFVAMEIQEQGDPPVPTPVVIGHLELAGNCQAIEVRDGIAFIAARDGGLHVVDVSVPSDPRSLGQVITEYANGVAVSKSGIVVVSDKREGLIVLGSPAPFADRMPPSAVRTLLATSADSSSMRLSWQAPGNDGLTGTASEYDIRYSEGPIEASADWDGATQCEDEPVPSKGGSVDRYRVTGLFAETEYFFALKTVDQSRNWSALSNIATAMTPGGNVAPTLREGSLSPSTGYDDTPFVFEVIYEDGEGDPPSSIEVVLNGSPFPMVEVTDTYQTGALYRYETTLGVGAWDHTFTCTDGFHSPVATRRIDGPWVGIALFSMGSTLDEPGRDVDETRHEVVLTVPIEMADHEVTQDEYESLMGSNPSRFIGSDRPVERVSWFDAVTYCNARSVLEGYTPAYEVDGGTVNWNRAADGYRLPTEAEWEYSCRAGSESAFSAGPIVEQACGIDPVLDGIGWYCGNAEVTTPESDGMIQTHEVGLKSPNTFGLYDMHGNVWEWCWDVYTADLGAGVAIDPVGSPGGPQRAVRGGSWYYFARECRSASRMPYWPNSKDDIVGFRVVRTVY